MAWGRRCEIGCESWPDEPVYATCPECGEPTKRWRNLDPLDAAEARSILLHKQFDRYYERRCRLLGVPVEGPLPERKTASLPSVSSAPRRPSGGAARAQSA